MKEDIDSLFQTEFNDWQGTLMIWRRVQLSLGCLVLLAIIANLCYRKLYIYNTTRLFMYVCICCFIGMFVVLLHIPDHFTAGKLFAYDQPANEHTENYILKILNKMKNNGDLFLCGLEAFINLFMYNLSYLFAILISYNVFCVITDNYRGFMRTLIRKPKLLIILVSMFVTYLLPLIFMFVPSDFEGESYFYSYGPTGFTKQVEIKGSNREAVLLFFCGTCYNPNSNLYRSISIIHIHVIFPLFMLIFHLIIIQQNRRRTKNIKKDYLNSKQQFLLNSGKISIVLFIIQLLNGVKLIISIITSWYVLITILNFFFDIYPFVLLIFYWRYTKQQRGLQHGSSTLIQQ